MAEKLTIGRGITAGLLNRERDILGSFLSTMNVGVSGRENLEKLDDKPAIFVLFPHRSHLDSLLIRYVLTKERRYKLAFLAKADYWGNGIKKIAGLLTNDLILLQTDGQQLPVKAFRQTSNLMKKGFSIGISPEGSRTLKPIEERPFEPGVGLILTLTNYQYPIVPVILQGTGEIWPKGQTLPHPFVIERAELSRREVRIHMGEPIYYSPVSRDQRETQVEDLRRRCIDLYHEMPFLPV